jgi:hypothetical protein
VEAFFRGKNTSPPERNRVFCKAADLEGACAIRVIFDRSDRCDGRTLAGTDIRLRVRTRVSSQTTDGRHPPADVEPSPCKLERALANAHGSLVVSVARDERKNEFRYVGIPFAAPKSVSANPSARKAGLEYQGDPDVVIL